MTITFTKRCILFCTVQLLWIGYGFAQAPRITSFSPATAAAGSTLTISGTGLNALAASNQVLFGAVSATVTSASPTSLTVVVPTGANYQPISVLNSANQLTAYSPLPFLLTFAGKGSITTSDIAARVSFATGTGPTQVATGDLDGDGKPDLVAVNNTTNNISIFRNTATVGATILTSSLATKIDLTTGNGPFYAAIGDLDGDGKPEIVVVNFTSNTVSVFYNNSTKGNIAFAASVDFTTGTSPRGVAIADIDGDGKPDIIVTNQASNSVSVFANQSTTGSITATSFAAKVDFATGANPRNLAVGDLDGDGRPDIAVANFGTTTTSVLLNTGSTGISTATFATKVDFTVGLHPYSVAMGDIDGDGKLDLLLPNQGSNTVSVLRNTFTKGSISSGSFATTVDFATGTSPSSVSIGDLDGDGKPDVAVTNQTASTISILKNTASSGSIVITSLADKVDITTASTPYNSVIEDIDGDGKPDIVTANNGGNTISILRNTPVQTLNTQATGVVFPASTATTATINWVNGNGTARAVFMAAVATGSPAPANATTYTANVAYGSGTQIGSTGWYCVYNGAGNSVTVTGLTAGTTYRVMVLDYSGAAGSESYLTTTSTNNPNNVTIKGTYYSKATGDLSTLSTYGTATDGTGTAPTDFNGSGTSATYQLANRSSYALTTGLTIGSTLNIPSGATLDLAGNTLTTGAIAGAGTLTGSNTSSLVLNATTASLAFATGKEQLNNLTLGSAASVTLNSALNVAATGTVSLGANAVLNTSGLLTLKSTISGTALISALGSGASISGNVTVERYVADKRAWRLITSPVNSSQTINAAWQEGASGASSDPKPGYGTFIIGSSTANGFDIAGSSGSLLVYDGSAFNSAANTNVATLSSNTGYFLFSIGNRALNPATAGVHSSTTLRSTGTVRTGTQSTPVTAAGYTLVGNPYAAPVDFSQVTRSSSVPNQFYIWDISLGTYGGYVLVSNTGSGYTSVPTSPSGLSNIIPSGAAIFVQADGINAGSLTFNESSKAGAAGSGSFSNFATSVITNTKHNFRVNLNSVNTDGTATLVDGVMAAFADGYSNKVDAGDALKLMNFDENIALIRSGKQLTIERRAALVTKDTIFIQLLGMKPASYQVQIDPTEFNQSGTTAYLNDAYLHTRIRLDVSKVSNLAFTATSDTASYKNRFQITFAPESGNGDNLTKISHLNASVIAYPNPATQKQINLSFDGMPAGSYSITVTNTFGQVMQRDNMTYNGSSSGKTLTADYSTGVYMVNIQSTGYSQSIKVIIP